MKKTLISYDFPNYHRWDNNEKLILRPSVQSNSLEKPKVHCGS